MAVRTLLMAYANSRINKLKPTIFNNRIQVSDAYLKHLNNSVNICHGSFQVSLLKEEMRIKSLEGERFCVLNFAKYIKLLSCANLFH